MLYKTALIVPTFSPNSSLIIDTLISNINNQSIGEVDIIVVNNNSFPLQLQNKLKKGEIFMLNGKKNLGSAGGFYLGMKFAYERGYDVYILGDDDAVLLDDNALEILSGSSSANRDTAFQLTWKERKDAGEEASAAYSCYGAFSHEMLSKYGFYSPFFFYGGEDAAYEWKLREGGIKFEILSPSFSHPVKRGMTYSRGSSGLSTFRHNSILQHFWTIFFSSSWGNKARSVAVVHAYLIFLFYGVIWFEPYFRSQMLYNICNIFCYFPPILLRGTFSCFYPRYRNSGDDEKYDVCSSQSADIITSKGLVQSTGESTKKMVLDTWFPVYAVGWPSWMRALWQHDEFFLLHGYEGSDGLQVKPLVRWKGKTTKMLSLIVSGILFPPLLLLGILTFCAVAIKYGIAAIILLVLESRYFRYFTTSGSPIEGK